MCLYFHLGTIGHDHDHAAVKQIHELIDLISRHVRGLGGAIPDSGDVPANLVAEIAALNGGAGNEVSRVDHIPWFKTRAVGIVQIDAMRREGAVHGTLTLLLRNGGYRRNSIP